MSLSTLNRRSLRAALALAFLVVPAGARASAPEVAPVEPPEVVEVPASAPVAEAPAPAPAPAPASAPAPAPVAEARPRGLVIAGTVAVNFLPVFPVPSGELSLFLGGALPIQSSRAGAWLALGYRGTLAGGYADGLTGDLIALRHHLALQGARGRFYFGVSAGLVHFPALEPDARRVLAFEGEGRLGGLLGSGDVKFLIGAQMRVTGVARQFQSGFLLPTIGMFFGVNFGPRMHTR